MEVIPDVSQNRYYKELFKGVHSMMIAPIRSKDKVFGLLDIRRKDNEPFPIFAQQMAELLGNQFGLYYELIETVANLRRTEKKLTDSNFEIEASARANAQAFADWQHQIRGPINQAYGRVQDMIRIENSDIDNGLQSIKVLRGLLGKAKRTSGTLRLFSEMAKLNPLQFKQEVIAASDLVKLLIETCQDNRLLASRSRRLTFEVKPSGFYLLNERPLKVDIDLMEQAINNVVDNAFKYSYSNTTIQVQGIALPHHFGIVVINEGIPLSSEDVKSARVRGWRGDQAQGHVGEGSGIWVVESIMNAHGGKLELAP